MPKKLTFGCEIEMFSSYTGRDDALQMFRDAGLCTHDRIHSYHCRCSECSYRRPGGALLAAQTDPSVGIEFITRILSNRNNRDMADLRNLKTVYAQVQERTGFYPDGVMNCGNHIHVGWPTGVNPRQQSCVTSMLHGLWTAEMDLWQRTIATGGAPQVRGYNGTPRLVSGDYWASSWIGGNPGTIELRMWNTPRDPERLLVHPALSVAQIHWALDVLDEEGDIVAFQNARSASQWAQDRARGARKRIAKIVREIWLDRTSANTAAELVAA